MSGIGGFVHERVALDRLEAAFHARGFDTNRPCRTGKDALAGGHVDLAVMTPQGVIAIEVELSAKRIHRDVAKAAALDAAELWLIAPSARTIAAIKRRMATLDLDALRCPRNRKGRRGRGRGRVRGIVVLTLGQALQRISRCFPIVFRGECEVENK
jgi:hypothetical protein